MRHPFLAFSISLLVLAASSGAHAQSIGFKVGASSANQDVEPDVETGSITSFAGGGFLRLAIGRVGVQLEALSITKGSEAANGDETRIEYIEVPLLLHLPLSVSQSFAPYIIAGPFAAFDIDCEQETSTGTTTDCADREKTDVGVSAGGGLGFAVGPGALLLEGRYSWGLKNIDNTDVAEIKNRNALFVIGYEIPIGRRF